MVSGHLREIFVINFAQGGNIMAYRRFTGTPTHPEPVPAYIWDATYQKINNVWVPQKTKSLESFDDGSVRIEEIEWVNQKINQKIPEERFTVKGIGAFQGMEVIDYRIGGKGFRATGDEYPPEYELPVQSFSYTRLIFLCIGIALIIISGGSLLYRHFKGTGGKQ